MKLPNPLVGIHQTSDGRHISLVMLQAVPYWADFCEHIDRPDLIDDPRFDTPRKLAENASEAGNVTRLRAGAARPLRDQWSRATGYGTTPPRKRPPARPQAVAKPRRGEESEAPMPVQHPLLTRKRMMIEMGSKHALIILLFLALYRPLSGRFMRTMPPGAQESVIELMGLLMAAAIIGAFELAYSRTNLDEPVQRFLAHFTKLTLYSSILLLMDIAVKAARPSGEDLARLLVVAATPIAIALVLYDFWDALRALDGRSAP